LWAGFMALVNQRAARDGKPPMGFINPLIYTLARRANYAEIFHDITTGDNTSPSSPDRFHAVPGYDLCTGWGTPKGNALIEALQEFAGPIWVDFTWVEPGAGTYNRPFRRLAAGVSAASPGGTILFRSAGTSPETMTITKPLTMRAEGGPATVGR
jgi:hypothetical protein